MAEQQSTSTQREETYDPRNPPNSVTSPQVRTAALWAYLGPILALSVVVLIALLYWANRDGSPTEDGTRTIGTSGDTSTPGGGNPAPTPDSTRDEVKDRDGR